VQTAALNRRFLYAALMKPLQNWHWRSGCSTVFSMVSIALVSKR